MSGFPDPEDEFELMYGDDMDIAFELEGNVFTVICNRKIIATLLTYTVHSIANLNRANQIQTLLIGNAKLVVP